MSFNKSEMPFRLVVVTALIVVASVASYGQGVGNMEVTGNLGIVGGIGSHGSFGASLGAPVTDRLILAGDLSYIPMGGVNVTMPGVTTSSSSKAFNFNGNLQYQFNPRRAMVPYAGGGLGFLHSSSKTSSTGLLPESFNASVSSTDLYFNVGGGLRYYVKERWGFKPELMIFAGPNTYVRFAGGIFYQFGE
jgi:hypothetical protein